MGEKVMMRVPNKRRGKLDARFQGPYEVVKRENDVYDIKELASGRVLKRHVELLKPYQVQNTANSRIGLIGKVSLLLLMLTLTGSAVTAHVNEAELPVR